MSNMGRSEKLEKLEIKAIRGLEFVLAAFLIVIIGWGLALLVMTIPWGNMAVDGIQFHDMIAQTLSDILLLVVGLEFAILLIHRRIEYLVEIVLFVIARKMLISNDGAVETLLGVVSLAGVYAIRKFLLVCPGCVHGMKFECAEDKKG